MMLVISTAVNTRIMLLIFDTLHVCLDVVLVCLLLFVYVCLCVCPDLFLSVTRAA